jgi:hypothetical protein
MSWIVWVWWLMCVAALGKGFGEMRPKKNRVKWAKRWERERREARRQKQQAREQVWCLIAGGAIR